MSKSTAPVDLRDSTLERVAALICECLHRHGIDAVLSGGAVVSIYTDNEFQSRDLDFITPATRRELDQAMAELGFRRGAGRHYEHSQTNFIVEFPSGPLMAGHELVTRSAERPTPDGAIRLLTPTDAVKDRLAAFFHWSDRQALEQALAIVRRQPVDWTDLDRWANREAAPERYAAFLLRINALSLRRTST